MKYFAELCRRLDDTPSSKLRIQTIQEYLDTVPPEDAAWAIYFLSGHKLKRIFKVRQLRDWAAQAAQIPEWLFEESLERVGDFAETVSLLLPDSQSGCSMSLTQCVTETLLDMKSRPETEQRDAILKMWRTMTAQERLIWNKLITGSMRIRVSKQTIVRALSGLTGLPCETLTHRLMGNWEPSAAFYRDLLSTDDKVADRSRPYPLCLAHPLTDPIETLGSLTDWIAEWKWDGIRAQFIKRSHSHFLWSRGEELITDQFPDLKPVFEWIPDGTVLDGEIVAWSENVLPFSQLQRRLGRKTVGKKLLTEVPVRFIAFDLLEKDGIDIRHLSLYERRRVLEQLISDTGLENLPIMISEPCRTSNWDELAKARETSRERHVEGLMLKSLSSAYGVGRVSGHWWKWKIEPYSADAVLVYAQRGSGRRASLYTDYTFAVWNNNELVTFAKAYSGLTDAEIIEVDRFVRQNTLERFGPVVKVAPRLVFELHFDGIRISKRHKCGIAVRFPRIHRWRNDKHPNDADHLDTLAQLATNHREG